MWAWLIIVLITVVCVGASILSIRHRRAEEERHWAQDGDLGYFAATSMAISMGTFGAGDAGAFIGGGGDYGGCS